MGSSFVAFLYAAIFSLYLHPVHVSVTTIEVDTDSCNVKVQVKLFTDDFQRLINTVNSTELNLGTKGENPNANELMASYITSHLFVDINGKQVSLNFLDRKMNEDSIWIVMNGCYDKGKKGKVAIHSAVIQNSIFLDLYDDQSNLVIFSLGNGTEKGYMMNIANLRQEIELQ